MKEKFIKDYFTFSKKERVAIVILILIIIASIILPFFIKPSHKKVAVDKDLLAAITTLQSKQSTSKFNKENNADTLLTQQIQLFYFDPNTLDETGWRKLGLREKTIKTIINYVSKGGKFKNAEDIRKIWGLRKDEADRLIPFIRIVQNENTTYKKYDKQKNEPSKTVLLDINIATPYQLKQVPNIGNAYPYRIVNYREKLGGYLNLQQLHEVYGMTDSVYNSILPYIFITAIEIKKININIATEEELSNHPYINKSIAKAIIIQRNKYGVYQSIQELKQKIIFLKEDVFNKMEPYITVQNN
jgi:competence protein ComEA